MAIDRKFWAQHITEHHAPPYNCPTCNRGTLKLVADSIRAGGTALARRERAEEYWDPSQDVARFVALLECNNGTCQETVVVVGKRFTEAAYDGEGGQTWVLEYHPYYFDPPLRFFRPPFKCPSSIVDELVASFRLVKVDPSAAAARLRTAVERFLDTQNIKARVRRSGRIVRLSLHERVELFKKVRPELAEALMAVKWLGNAGTHTSSLTKDDILDGYDMVEHVLDEVITERSVRVRDLARQINKRKGPRSGTNKKK
jgi:hypothetical protein